MARVLGQPKVGRGTIPRGVGPISLGDEVVQRRVGGLDPARVDARRHRFDALALARQQ